MVFVRIKVDNIIVNLQFGYEFLMVEFQKVLVTEVCV